MTTAKKMPDNETYSAATIGYRVELRTSTGTMETCKEEEKAIVDRDAQQPTIGQDAARAAA
ncbi:MAG: hypothetical protein OXU74_01545 [Gemmatimonadota bacterium]|nr:hypothetical protein [Gemmatimonadota bacterium]